MRVLLLGAYGFIGSAIARELVSRGHEVTGLGRDLNYGKAIHPQLRWVGADLSQMTAASDWLDLLSVADVVINASGLLQSGDGGLVEAVQLHSIKALTEACESSRINLFVQVSAAGADASASSDFMATKAQADELLARSSVSYRIIRPGLVIGSNAFGGTELIRAAAALPMRLELPFKPIQCVALSDVVLAVVEAMEATDLPDGIFDLVEREERSLESIILEHRHWLGLTAPRRSVKVPLALFSLGSRLSDWLGYLGWRSPLRRNGLLALQAGVHGTAEHAVALLGREAIPLEQALASRPSGKQDRLHSRLLCALPIMLASLFVMWAASGIATLLQLDEATSILLPSGIGDRMARVMAIGGGWLDILLAAALLWRRTVRPALVAMVGLTLGVYLIGGTLLVPSLWADPLAPFAKALPATMLALVAYWMLEKR